MTRLDQGNHATRRPVLVYLYGPPAAGKLTVARELHALTGLALFHNHLTVNALRSVFEFGTPAFTEIVHRVRQDVFATAMHHDISLIFTNNSLWEGRSGHQRFLEFATHVRDAVDAAGGRCVFVRITAPPDVLMNRIDAVDRRANGKLVSSSQLTDLLAAAPEPVVPSTALTIDTSTVFPRPLLC